MTYIPTFQSDQLTIHGRALLHKIRSSYLLFNEHVEGVDWVNIDEDEEVEVDLNDPQQAILSTIEKDFIAFIKPFNSDLDDGHPENYYMEREWRKLGNMKFDDKHIKSIVVAKEYKERLAHYFPELQDKVHET